MCPSDAVTLIRLVECVHCTETQIACVACPCLRSTHATRHRTRLIREVSSWATEAHANSPSAILVAMMAAVLQAPHLALPEGSFQSTRWGAGGLRRLVARCLSALPACLASSVILSSSHPTSFQTLVRRLPEATTGPHHCARGSPVAETRSRQLHELTATCDSSRT